MEFPIRCFTCNKIIGNKYECYKKWLSYTFRQAEKASKQNETIRAAFIKYVIEQRLQENGKIIPRMPTREKSCKIVGPVKNEWIEKELYRKYIHLTPLSVEEILNLLHIKQYCCRMLFITHVEIEFPDPDYLEKTFPRVKFINKKRKIVTNDTIAERNKYIKEYALIAR